MRLERLVETLKTPTQIPSRSLASIVLATLVLLLFILVVLLPTTAATVGALDSRLRAAVISFIVILGFRGILHKCQRLVDLFMLSLSLQVEVLERDDQLVALTSLNSLGHLDALRNDLDVGIARAINRGPLALVGGTGTV